MNENRRKKEVRWKNNRNERCSNKKGRGIKRKGNHNGKRMETLPLF